MVVAALWGGEESNDHHPYYEATFTRASSGDLKLLDVRRYWWDFAGIEGLAHWFGGLLGMVIGFCCVGVFASRLDNSTAAGSVLADTDSVA